MGSFNAISQDPPGEPPTDGRIPLLVGLQQRAGKIDPSELTHLCVRHDCDRLTRNYVFDGP